MPSALAIHFPAGLAQAQGGSASIVFWSLVLVAMLVVGFVVVGHVKKLMRDDDVSSSAGPAFTLSDLRQLHKDGHMTAEEFERAKGKMLATLKQGARDNSGDISKPAPPPSSGQNP